MMWSRIVEIHTSSDVERFLRYIRWENEGCMFTQGLPWLLRQWRTSFYYLRRMQETQAWSLGWEDHLEKGMTTHSSIHAWEIPWTEKPGRLQFKGSQRLRHNWVTNTHVCLNASSHIYFSKCNLISQLL